MKKTTALPGLEFNIQEEFGVSIDLQNISFQVLSNGKYKSVLHRSLVNKERMRMSWAVFVVPPHETVIGPLPELIDEKNPAKYSTKTYAEYRYRKFNKIPQ